MSFKPGNKFGTIGRPRAYTVKVEDLRRMREAKMGCPAIAAVYGCDQSTVRSWLRRHNLPTKLAFDPPSPAAIDAAIAATTKRLPKTKAES